MGAACKPTATATATRRRPTYVCSNRPRRNFPMDSTVTTGTWAARAAFALTVLVAVGVIVQSALAGAFYQGAHHHGLDVHKALGPALIVPAILAALVCAARLRTVPEGRRAFTAAAGSTIALAVETALGFWAGHHSGLLLLHVPIALGLLVMLSRQITSLAAIARAHH